MMSAGWVTDTLGGMSTWRDFAGGLHYIWRNNKGELHREDGPAKVYPDGSYGWYINGRYHREGGPAVVYSAGGTIKSAWYINGKLHREDGPAVVLCDETTEWYINGKKAKSQDHYRSLLSDFKQGIITVKGIRYKPIQDEPVDSKPE